MKRNYLLPSFFLLAISLFQCTKDDSNSVSDPCEFVNCLNGGNCNNGNCQCPEGFEGEFCEKQTASSYYGSYEGILTIETGDGGYSTSNLTVSFSASSLGADYMEVSTLCEYALWTSNTDFMYILENGCVLPFMLQLGSTGSFSGNQVTFEKFYINDWGIIYKNTFIGTKI